MSIGQNLIRLSVGLENKTDLLHDVLRALDAASHALTLQTIVSTK
ncbi:MAG: PLP-dependent transferase [Proteobacteria bacterium]|nr:PLP-dependent transferase [Pseudomonadota bacterium]